MRTLLALGALLSAVLAAPIPASASFAPIARVASKAHTGILDIASDPVAEIFIDGADTGKVTPQPRIELAAGHHKLLLVSMQDKARKRSIGFGIDAGQTTKLTIHLAQE
ncbi:MAG: hypothetical protein ACREJ3_08990 [Polyangiaceae bacterium]